MYHGAGEHAFRQITDTVHLTLRSKLTISVLLKLTLLVKSLFLDFIVVVTLITTYILPCRYLMLHATIRYNGQGLVAWHEKGYLQYESRKISMRGYRHADACQIILNCEFNTYNIYHFLPKFSIKV